MVSAGVGVAAARVMCNGPREQVNGLEAVPEWLWLGHIFRIDPTSSEVVQEWRVEDPEVHGLTRSADGRIWIGDAAANALLVLER